MRRRWRVWALLAVALWAGATAPASAQAECPPPPTVDHGPPRDRGLLWTLTRDGRISFLFGTLHIGRPGWDHFGPRTTAALQATDTIALELDPTEPATQAAIAAHRPASVPAALSDRLAKAAEKACLPAGMLAALHPRWQAMLLSLNEARWLGLDARWGLDASLAHHARSTGRRPVALETVAIQAAAVLPEEAADSGAALVEQTLDQIDNGSARRVLARLSAAWQAGDLAALEDYTAWCECAPSVDDEALIRRVNDDRNPALADGIAALHGQGQRVFAAVGALHMTGPKALPRLLAERGFVVERVAFSR